MLRTRLYLSVLIVVLIATIISIVVWVRVRPDTQTRATVQKSCSRCAQTIVMLYEGFGPQAMSYELLGKEWNQWKSEGHPLPDDVEVKVVVYRGIDLTQVEKQFPVLKGKSDYRYLEYSTALLYLRENIEIVERNRQEEAKHPQAE